MTKTTKTTQTNKAAWYDNCRVRAPCARRRNLN